MKQEMKRSPSEASDDRSRSRLRRPAINNCNVDGSPAHHAASPSSCDTDYLFLQEESECQRLSPEYWHRLGSNDCIFGWKTFTKQKQFAAKCVIRIKQSGGSIKADKLDQHLRDIGLCASFVIAPAGRSTTFKNIIPTLKELKRIGANLEPITESNLLGQYLRDMISV